MKIKYYEFTQETIDFLNQWVPGWKEYELSGDILDVLYEVILDYGFDDRLNYNDFGERAQDAYNEVFCYIITEEGKE